MQDEDYRYLKKKKEKETRWANFSPQLATAPDQRRRGREGPGWLPWGSSLPRCTSRPGQGGPDGWQSPSRSPLGAGRAGQGREPLALTRGPVARWGRTCGRCTSSSATSSWGAPAPRRAPAAGMVGASLPPARPTPLRPALSRAGRAGEPRAATRRAGSRRSSPALPAPTAAGEVPRREPWASRYKPAGAGPPPPGPEPMEAEAEAGRPARTLWGSALSRLPRRTAPHRTAPPGQPRGVVQAPAPGRGGPHPGQDALERVPGQRLSFLARGCTGFSVPKFLLVRNPAFPRGSLRPPRLVSPSGLSAARRTAVLILFQHKELALHRAILDLPVPTSMGRTAAHSTGLG